MSETKMPLYGVYDVNSGKLLEITNIGKGGEVVAPISAAETVHPEYSKQDAQALMEAIPSPAPTANTPWGWGKHIQLDAGQVTVPVLNMPSAHSISGVSFGNSIVYFGNHSFVSGESAVIKIKDDARKGRWFNGNAVYSQFGIDGASTDASHAYAIHGVWGPAGVSEPRAPVMYNMQIMNCTGSGVKLEERDQVISFRLQASNNGRYGLEMIGCSDSKHYSPGLGVNAMGALYLERNATPKFYGGDFWLGDGGSFIGKWTVTLQDQDRALFDGSEIEGRVGIIGRNDQTSNKWRNSGNVFHAINFKIDPEITQSYSHTNSAGATKTVSAFCYLEDVDGVLFSDCKLQYSDNFPPAEDLAATPDYIWHLDTVKTGAPNIAKYPGAVRVTGGSNLVHNRGRNGDGDAIVGFKKHYSNRPELIEWDFDPGALVCIPYNSAKPPRNYVLCGTFGGAAATYTKAEFPFGYLWATLVAGGTLDDVNTTFAVPAAPTIAPAGYAWMMRVWP